MTTTDDVAAALRFDPLQAAEDMTGQSYKDDKGTMALGMLLALGANNAKDALLRSVGDTTHRSTLAEQLAVFMDLGFREVLRDAFTGHDEQPETFHVLWHPDGLLATCESYQTTRRNTANVYYNVRFDADADRWGVTSSGSMRDGVWVGDHDAREGIRHNIAALRGAGEFLPVWVERPFLWLLTYADDDVPGYDYRAINEARISRLPADVRAAITPEVSK